MRTPRPHLANTTTRRVWARFPFLREQHPSKIPQKWKGEK
nr:MAG TPA: hypothetical protein [Caudoviricetes sp.]